MKTSRTKVGSKEPGGILDQCGPGPDWPKTLSDTIKARIALLREMVADSHGLSQREWESGRRRDADMDGEVRLWMQMAALYLRYCEGKTMTMDEGRDALKVLWLGQVATDLAKLRETIDPSSQSAETTGFRKLVTQGADQLLDDGMSVARSSPIVEEVTKIVGDSNTA